MRGDPREEALGTFETGAFEPAGALTDAFRFALSRHIVGETRGPEGTTIDFHRFSRPPLNSTLTLRRRALRADRLVVHLPLRARP